MAPGFSLGAMLDRTRFRDRKRKGDNTNGWTDFCLRVC
jgi:hypothetical protein